MLLVRKSKSSSLIFFFFNDTATTEIYTLSLHDALPISVSKTSSWGTFDMCFHRLRITGRSEEHTSELQSPCNLVCRLLLEKKKNLNAPTSMRAVRSNRNCAKRHKIKIIFY